MSFRGDSKHRRAGSYHQLAVASLLVATILMSSPARGFGVLVTNATASSDTFILASRTLVTRDSSGRVQQMTEIHYARGEENSFYWLLPVIADGLVDVRVCRGDFEALTKIAEPRILLRHRSYTDDGCSGDNEQQVDIANIGAHEYSGTPVDPPPSPEALAPFEDFTELLSWFDDHEVVVPGNAAGTLHHYVDHGYTFIATEVSFISSGTICLEATYDFPTRRHYDYLLPLKTAATTTVPDMEVLLYVIDDERIRPYVDPDTGAASYFAVELNPHELRAMADGETNYPELFRAAVESRPAPAFVVEYSAPLDEIPNWLNTDMRWLTRLRIRISPGDVPDDEPGIASDLALVAAGEVEVDRDYQIIVASRRRHGLTMVAAWAFAMVGASLLFGRRRREGK